MTRIPSSPTGCSPRSSFDSRQLLRRAPPAQPAVRASLRGVRASVLAWAGVAALLTSEARGAPAQPAAEPDPYGPNAAPEPGTGADLPAPSDDSLPASGDASSPETTAEPGPSKAGGEPSEPTADRAATTDREPEPTPEELAEIEAALSADASASTAAGAQASAAAPSSSTVLESLAFLPDISLVLDLALAYFTSDEPLQTGGHDPKQNGPNLQQLELSLGKSVDPYFRFDANIVFSLFGVELEEAYGTTLSLPWNLQLRAGQMLTRFGRINASHPHAWDFVDQPFFFGKVFGGEGNRGLGLELSYLMPLPWYVELVGSSTWAAGESTARSFYGADDRGISSPLDLQNTAAVKQFFDLSEDWSLMWGLSAANGPNPHGRNTRTDVYGTDIYLKYRPITRQSYTTVSLQAEWLYRRRQVPEDVLQDTGGYAQLLWRFAQRWATAARYEYATPTYAEDGSVVVDPLDPAQIDDRHRVSLNVTFWPTEFSRIRWQTAGDFPDWLPMPAYSAMLALELVAGVHGSHKF